MVKARGGGRNKPTSGSLICLTIVSKSRENEAKARDAYVVERERILCLLLYSATPVFLALRSGSFTLGYTSVPMDQAKF